MPVHDGLYLDCPQHLLIRQPGAASQQAGKIAVVFGGETLQAMTNNEILAAVHEVRIPDEAGVGHFGVSWDQTMTRVMGLTTFYRSHGF